MIQSKQIRKILNSRILLTIPSTVDNDNAGNVAPKTKQLSTQSETNMQGIYCTI